MTSKWEVTLKRSLKREMSELPPPSSPPLSPPLTYTGYRYRFQLRPRVLFRHPHFI